MRKLRFSIGAARTVQNDVVTTDARKRRASQVAELLADEWPDLAEANGAASLVHQVETDLARGDLDNHFHEAVPFAQFGLMLLQRVGPAGVAREGEASLVAGVLADRFGKLDVEPTPELVARVAERMRAEGATEYFDSVIGDYARFGLRLLWRGRRDPAADAQRQPAPKPGLLGRILGRDH